MISVAEALERIARAVKPLAVTECSRDASLGAVLAEDIAAAADFPPFDRATMDGYAVRAADVVRAPLTLPLSGAHYAGAPGAAHEPGTASVITTGAALPAGADAVVRVEDTRREGQTVHLALAVPPGRFVMPRGGERRAGEVVLAAGARIEPPEIGILAALGRTRLRVRKRPRVAVLATGDELVESGQEPGPGQIRDSNGPGLAALLRQEGCDVQELGRVGDREQELRAAIARGLRHDLLVLSGGVSMGERDLVPAALEACGVRLHFQRVRIKPGKPVVFGTHEGGVVMGFPGNPVSGVVTFLRFGRAVLARLADRPLPELPRARLEGSAIETGGREYYHPARMGAEGQVRTIACVPYRSSADLFALAPADAFVCVPPDTRIEPGQSAAFLPLRPWCGL